MATKLANVKRGALGMRGVTLIELMVVVVIVAILASIAYPSYRNQVRKTARSEGQAQLLETAQALERCYSRFGRYNAASCPAVIDLAAPIPTDEGHYQIDDTVLKPGSFTLTATPQGDQANDGCGNLTLTSTGAQGSTSGSADCW